MDLEVVDHKQSHPIKESWKTVLMMSYQSLGVVYGDLSTSPLYVYKSTFADDITHSETNEEIFGVVSFVFWTLTLIPLLKYVFILLRVNDNGEGGTFALYSLLCRHAKLGFLPNSQVADEELSAYKKDHDHEEDRVNLSMGGGSRTRIRRVLEKHRMLQQMLLLLTLLGTCMVIGDGIFTPAISVFSAVSGLQLSMSTQEHKYIELPIACIILVGLFALQHYGTRRIGFLFAPIVIIWLLCISMIGIYNIIYWNPRVYQAISPYYMYKFLKKTQKEGWMSLGGILLCMTGSEAMFADLGHFSHLSIKIAFTFIVYPSLILAYMGQAAYLSKHHILENNYHIGFYVSVPERLRWPTLVIAIMAAVVGSQAVITGTFSIIKQCTALGCFPRVKIIHTSSKVHGQIYIPEINWILMILSLAVTVGFRDTKRLGNAVGLAVITVMLVTTCLMSLVIILCWNKSVTIAICFVAFFGTIESLYFSASLIKFREGAWLPITLSIIFMLIMYSWHYGSLKKYEFDLQNKVSIDWILSLGPSLGIVRVNGIGLISTDLVSGIPAIFSHFVTNLPAFHQVLVFLCVKSVHVPYVQSNERFLVGRIGPREYRLYRCIVRYGYHDIHKDDVEFEKDLVCSIAEFIQSENSKRNKEVEDASQEKMEVVPCRIRLHEDDEIMAAGPSEEQNEIISTEKASPIITPRKKKVRFLLPPGSPKLDASTSKELQELSEAREAGVAFIASHSHVRAKRGSGLLKKLAINFGYDFLSRNSRGPEGFAMNMSGHANTLEVGMVYLV